ncbi:MAG TPA: GNAT family N-acetyltransferase [Ilumatobacter sp.]|nr:GNAT family N-acetyltransferase [Ilumatobacter sp.]
MGSDLVLRSWSRADLPAMAALINERVAANGGLDEPVTEATITAVYDHLGSCDPVRDIVVATDGDGTVCGYARTISEDMADGSRTYALAFEGRGEAHARMFEWAAAHALEQAAADPHPDRWIDAGAADGTERQRLIVEHGGFVPYAWSAVMVRPTLTDVPDLALPADVLVRPADQADLRAIWEADVEAFRDHNHQLAHVGEDEWEQFLVEAEPGTGWWQVAWDASGVVGQVRTRVVPGEAERIGRRRAWTENISTRCDRRGEGIASALIAASLRQLAAAGFDEAALGVDLENPTGALVVYERLGYQVVQRHTGYRHPVT